MKRPLCLLLALSISACSSDEASPTAAEDASPRDASNGSGGARNRGSGGAENLGSGGTQHAGSGGASGGSHGGADASTPPSPDGSTSPATDAANPPSRDGSTEDGGHRDGGMDAHGSHDASGPLVDSGVPPGLPDATTEGGSRIDASRDATVVDVASPKPDAALDAPMTIAFPGSTLVDATQGAMIDGWVGSAAQIWKLCYSTDLHTRAGTTFHANCDFKGPSVSIARVSYQSETRVIGGYDSASWFSPATATYSTSPGSFLFSVTNAFKHDFPGSSTVNYFTLNNKFYGPTFGAGNDWYVHSQLLGGTCRPGYTYQCRVGTLDSAECNADFCGTPSQNESYVLEVLEVWVH